MLRTEEEEFHQSGQMRLIRRNTNTRIEYPSTNLETVINVSYDQKNIGLPNKSTQSPGPKRKQRRIVRPNRSKSRAEEHKVVLVPHSTGVTHVTGPLRTETERDLTTVAPATSWPWGPHDGPMPRAFKWWLASTKKKKNYISPARGG